MQPKTPKLLEDIRAAATYIQAVTAGLALDAYRQDQTLRFAVERNFEIIGEAANRITHLDPDTAVELGPTAQIVAFRNLLIHGYDQIDESLVWRIAQNDVPPLLAKVTALLANQGPDQSG